MKIKKHSAFTLIELLVVISIIAILAGFALPVFANAQKKGNLTNSLNNAKQIGLALKMYAGDHDGVFPRYTDPDEPTNKVATTNAAFTLLMPKYTNSKAIFINKKSKWCDGAGASANASDQYKVLSKECDWAYVRGLTDTSDSRWPLIATAFADAQGTYTKGTSKKGGVWDGTDAVVVNVDTSARIVSEGSGLVMESDTVSFIGRPDQKKLNAFKQASDWLDGDDIQVLMPES
jgi:prepilin-type N-terminal cleavage/methylation domain-containing protein